MDSIDITVVRPNELVEARFNLSAKQNDIVDLVLDQLQEDENLRYEIKISDYYDIIEDTTNMYRDFKRAAKEFKNSKAGFTLYNYQGKKEVDLFWFTEIYYEDKLGKVTFELSPKVKRLFLQMKGFTKYNIKNPLNLSSKYSKRLYYYLKRFEDTGFRKDILTELIKKLECPKSYDKYSLFKTKVLDMAKDEINSKTDIAFDYYPIRKSGKTISLEFKVYKNEEYKEIENILKRGEDEVAETVEVGGQIELNDLVPFSAQIEDVNKITEGRLSQKDIKAILEAANFNIEIINEKYKIAKDIDTYNLTGFMIQSIRENYKKTSKDGKNNKKNAFNNFEQRDYDFDELEKQLLQGNK